MKTIKMNFLIFLLGSRKIKASVGSKFSDVFCLLLGWNLMYSLEGMSTMNLYGRRQKRQKEWPFFVKHLNNNIFHRNGALVD